MKVYVGGKFSDKKKIRAYMDRIEKMGNVITHDWTSFEYKPEDEDELFMDDGCSENMEMSAKYDIEGVKDCDVFLAIFEDKDYPYRGTFTELGCALGLEKKIIIMCPEPKATCRTNCFFHHPKIMHVDYFEQAVEMIDMIMEYAEV